MAITYTGFEIADVDDKNVATANQITGGGGTLTHSVAAVTGRIRLTIKFNADNADISLRELRCSIAPYVYTSIPNQASNGYFIEDAPLGLIGLYSCKAIQYMGDQSGFNYGGYIGRKTGSPASTTDFIIVLFIFTASDIKNWVRAAAIDNSRAFLYTAIDNPNYLSNSGVSVFSGTKSLSVAAWFRIAGQPDNFALTPIIGNNIAKFDIGAAWYNTSQLGQNVVAGLDVAYSKSFKNTVGGAIVADATGVKNNSLSSPDLFWAVASNKIAPTQNNTFQFQIQGSSAIGGANTPTKARITIFQTDGSGATIIERLHLAHATIALGTNLTVAPLYNPAVFNGLGVPAAYDALYGPRVLSFTGAGNSRIINVGFDVKAGYFKAGKMYRIAVELYWGASLSVTTHLSPALIANAYPTATVDNYFGNIYDQFNAVAEGFSASGVSVHSRLKFELKLSQNSYNANANFIGFAGTYAANFNSISARLVSSDGLYSVDFGAITVLPNQTINSEAFSVYQTKEIRLPNKTGLYYIDWTVTFLQPVQGYGNVSTTQTWRMQIDAIAYNVPELQIQQFTDTGYPTTKVPYSNCYNDDPLFVVETEKFVVENRYVAALFYPVQGDANPDAVKEEDAYVPLNLAQLSANDIFNTEPTFLGDDYHAYRVKKSAVTIGGQFYAAAITRDVGSSILELIRANFGTSPCATISVRRTATNYIFNFNPTALTTGLIGLGSVITSALQGLRLHNSPNTALSTAPNLSPFNPSVPIAIFQGSNKAMYTILVDFTYTGYNLRLYFQYTFLLPQTAQPMTLVKTLRIADAAGFDYTF